MSNIKDFLVIGDHVKKALEEKRPVVALETTIISHGMPYPQNLETALEVEKIVRENGATPATLGVINGKIKVGLTEDEIRYFATADDIIKMSRRDIPVVVANGLNGATTVATSIIIARMAGIKVLVTGGIGGVHRKAQETFDISRDLQEIANNDICVVCAGAKSILDIGLSLEYLETFGVPVLGYKTKEMPAFYTRESGYELDYRMDSYEEIARTVKTKWQLGLSGGVVVANPIPEEDQMDKAVIDEAIDKALKEAEEKGVHGKETTPFLLDKVLEVTGGDSLVANIALVKNNAKVGSNIAKEIY